MATTLVIYTHYNNGWTLCLATIYIKMLADKESSSYFTIVLILQYKSHCSEMQFNQVINYNSSLNSSPPHSYIAAVFKCVNIKPHSNMAIYGCAQLI